jgi:hypothetical protein
MRRALRHRNAIWALGVTILLVGCAAPIGIRIADPREVQVYLTRSALTGDQPTDASLNELRRYDLLRTYEDDPDAALAKLHAYALAEGLPPDALFALAKEVINGEAACALVDDAQFAELPHLEGADGLHAVWQSDTLPPMVVSAFPAASADERKRFQENLAKLCDEEAQSTCAEVGIVSLKAATASSYAPVIAAYGR